MDGRPKQTVELAKERFQLRDYYGCLHLLNELVEQGRAYADAHHLMGLSYHLIGQPDKALESFAEALKLNPRYHEAHIHRGIVLNELGRRDEALEAFSSAEEHEMQNREGLPGHVASKLANQHAQLADAYHEAGALAEAVNQYRTALKLGPTFHDLRYRLAKLLLEAGRALEAKEELETLVSAQPDKVEARASLGLAWYMAGDLAQAEGQWNKARELDPDNSRVHAYLAMLERGQ
ncbi:MAG: tetratricopeptide repeat protein [Gemmatimonadota bacterium]|nr:tetratricopeptide repeat protein [Gemmatimonadota bacterium]